MSGTAGNATGSVQLSVSRQSMVGTPVAPR